MQINFLQIFASFSAINVVISTLRVRSIKLQEFRTEFSDFILSVIFHLEHYLSVVSSRYQIASSIRRYFIITQLLALASKHENRYFY
jgi:hypothetical protein